MISKEGQASVGVVFALAMVAYLLTVCPTVYAGDSGDFITASYTMGIAHPTGYPLYMLVGKAFSLLPFGSIAYRYNLLSAIAGALAAVLVCLSIRLLTKSWLAGVGGGLLVAFSESLWDQTTVAEVYALNGFFTALIVWLILRWRDRRDKAGLFWVACSFGLALTNHVSTVLYLPAFAYLIYAGNRRLLSRLDFRGPLAAAVSPLILYSYLPIRALSNPEYNWGNPSNLQRFLDHVTGAVHMKVVVFSLTSAEFFERFFGLVFQYIRQFSLSGALVLGGLYRHGGRNRVLLNFTGLMLAADIVYAMFLNDVSLEITTFCIPSIIVLGLWSGFGFVDLSRWVRSRTRDARGQYAAVAAAVLIVLAGNYWLSDKSQNVIAYDFGTNMLKTVDRNGVIFADGDNVVMPLSYLLHVEGLRPDVTMYEQTGILSFGLYGEDYFNLPPEEHARRQMEREMGVITSGRPVYYAAPVDWTIPGYHLRQTGLLYRVVRDGETIPDIDYWGRYTMRQVWNSTITRDFMTKNIVSTYYLRLADDLQATDKDTAVAVLKEAAELFPGEVAFKYNLGNVYLSKQDYRAASEQYLVALKIDPNSASVHNNFGYSLAKMGQNQAALAEYLAAIRLDPTYFKARINLAVFLANQSRYAEAAEQYKVILRLSPTYARGYFDLGRVYYSYNKTKEAAAMWRQYLQLAPGDPNAAQIMSKIAEIEGNDTNMTAH